MQGRYTPTLSLLSILSLRAPRSSSPFESTSPLRICNALYDPPASCCRRATAFPARQKIDRR